MADKAGDGPVEAQLQMGDTENSRAESEATNKEDGESEMAEEAMSVDDEGSECYCGKGRNLGTVEIQCGFCFRWFHQDCIGCYLGTAIPFMTNYQFACRGCSPNGLENFTKKVSSFPQICYTAIANLCYQTDPASENPQMFSRDGEIIPFIDKQWENLTTQTRRTKQTWHATVAKTLSKETEMFTYKEENLGDPHFGLTLSDLYKVGPYSEILKQSGSVPSVGKSGGFVDSGKGRGYKRKAPDSVQLPGVKQKRGDLGPTTKQAPHGYPLEHPFNKDGYRYILAEADPHAPNRQAFDESLDWAGKPIPGYLYRTFLGTDVLFALNDRAPQLKISTDRLSVTGEKGYSMVRATHGVRRGAWYFEVLIEEMPQDSATRIGWSQSLGNLQAPCGYDKFSYSFRSRLGTRFHQSRGKHYCDGGYSEGDVLGFFIHLPEPDNPGKLLPNTFKDRPLVKFKSHLYYEEKDHVAETEKSLKPLIGSQMIMYKNGSSQGIAYEDVFEGVYYPAVSLYKNTKVTMNFGPDFKCPPQGLKDFRPMSDAASQTMVEYALADIIYHVENEGKLPEF
uniref:B30.2/SPRY domain-containing protein n=3 Tax=Magallana gigas TaxID=29159 RepID=A0A8W8MLK2_MAGGI|nr:set1/Ash2 histone methyltransferase complex subunit ASH2 isoform X1 [Crassostrea gigas]|eukprot:XP_011432333.1 PREDICTED: set1/Ash2 histone methyltransferase complex subunit ASH2-like isoform X1 [Crassostrea gigas]